MTPITALDIAGLRTHRLERWAYQHDCLWCGADSWAGAFHSQCVNAACSHQVSSPLDILARSMFAGDYDAAGVLVRKRLNVQDAGEQERKSSRAVLDFWLACCSRQTSSEAQQVAGRMSRDGRHILGSRFGATVLDRSMIDDLIAIAGRTGGEFPESWLLSPPMPCAAFVIQSTPHTIDRIVLLRNGPNEVVWNRRAAGISGLIGLTPGKPRYLAPSFEAALAMQFSLTNTGYLEEVAAVFNDPWKDDIETRWYPETEMLTAVVDDPTDIVKIQSTVDKFRLLGDNLRGLRLRHVNGQVERAATSSWDGLRVSYIITRTAHGSKSISAEAARLFEQTGSKMPDAAKIIAHYRDSGQILLADDFQKLAANRIIRRDQRLVVRETSGDYTVTTPYGTTAISNFHLVIRDSVLFRDRTEVYCRGTLTCGASSYDLVFPRSAVSVKLNRLQEALHTQLVIAGGSISGDLIPTIIDTTQFQRYIIPHLTSQIAHAARIEGVSLLGWSADRKVFHAPGLTITADGRRYEDTVIYPGIAALALFDGVKTWSDSCPQDLPQPCQDVIAMLIALAVRHYRRSIPRPALVLQTSDSVALLEGLTKAMGQRHVFELGQNVRDSTSVDGLHGYPFVASGYGRAQAHKTNVPCVILTDEGYRVEGEIDHSQIDAAGRALQFALVRVAEWCLATGADEFQEVPALDRHTSLMREGQWLITHVCDLEPWEISATRESSLERLFSQIPFADTKGRMHLTDGVTLRVDLSGLEFDADGLSEAFAAIGAKLTIDESSLTTDAAVLLPALDLFYGQAPELLVSATHDES